jgi:hypothetical protein
MTEANANGRVTLAVVQNEVHHVRQDIQALRRDILGKLDDHEDRIRAIERVSPWRSVAEAVTGGIAVIAIALGLTDPQ